MSATPLSRAGTGIPGLDAVTRGGLPRGRTTLLVGGPGAGKTVTALQVLVNGARDQGEPAIFVAFEERSDRVIANAASFGWDLEGLGADRLFFLDAQPSPDLAQSGDFDLLGMLAALDARVKEMGARRIVFDAIDMVLSLLRDPLAERREMYRLHEWLLARDLTAIITAKVGGETGEVSDGVPAGYLQFMVDCAIVLQKRVTSGVSERSLRVLKYRGSGYIENEVPVLIGDRGVEVAGPTLPPADPSVYTSERISTGVERLDTMLGGGFYRGASVLLTGAPGTAKTTLCGAFAQAASRRGERVVFVTFDSDPGEIVRNLASVDIDLDTPRREGLLLLTSRYGAGSSTEAHYFAIRALATEHRARCMVIDPLSTLANRGDIHHVYGVVERLTRWAKSEGITLFCSSLLDRIAPETESSPLLISTIADTWIHLSYLIHAGERNRALTIIKSRGTAHSNQVRELVLAGDGVTLTDVYTVGGEVLMGSLRWERERAARAEQVEKAAAGRRRLTELEAVEADLLARSSALQRQLEATSAERRQVEGTEAARGREDAELTDRLRSRRSGDAIPADADAEGSLQDGSDQDTPGREDAGTAPRQGR